ncbi:unnamed protein product [Miscanthus lutarioriparius]|uniref:Disease resistance protein At4g27190-like leucine-rich repeats domain-containing protein n=1 Tax=Miscanthus lutarioriparius TaxID=422564 RepID=A0A811QA96_9POAL|nr:unnamed protein product [Miscanthus lutarioriparius]
MMCPCLQVIQADTIEAAAERILIELNAGDTNTERTINTRDNVIYFDGWDGLGASAVLRAVCQRLATASEAPAGLQFDQVINIDCSKWVNRRAMQRVIAEQLELPAEVIDIIDRRDEEDDYRGQDQSSRDVIPQVVREIYQRIQNRRFLVIFYNGSNKDIDLANLGFPLQDLGFHLYSSNKVLWTFQGSFRLMPMTKVSRAAQSIGTTGVFLSAASSQQDQDPHVFWSYLVLQEAAELVAGKDDSSGINVQPEQVAECFLYTLNLCGMGRHFMMDYDLATHGCNYWICDGIIRPQQRQRHVDHDGLWSAAEALQREMQMDVDYYHHDHKNLPTHLVKFAEIMPCWTSPTYRVVQILDRATPIRCNFDHYDKLAVLKLSYCTFTFSLPPFLCCQSLKFLWLDHCRDMESSTDGDMEKADDIHQWIQRLFHDSAKGVKCDWSQGLGHAPVAGRLPNIRNLRVTKSTIQCGTYIWEDDLFTGMKKMEVLDLSGNKIISGKRCISATEQSCSLETIIIDQGCVELEHISLTGCSKLKNVLLRGLFEELVNLDISGSGVKRLDLSAMIALKLDEVILLDCNMLCAILWPPEGRRKTYFDTLRIQTRKESNTPSATSGLKSSALSVISGSRAPSEYKWYISVYDARLLWSLVPLKLLVAVISIGRVEQVLIDQNQEESPEGNNASIYADIVIAAKNHQQQAKGDGRKSLTSIMWAWPCPHAPNLEPSTCYMDIQDWPLGTKSQLTSQQTAKITIPDFICNSTRIMYVHDSLYITHMPGPAPSLGAEWKNLWWCRVERCPEMDCVFPSTMIGGENWTKIFYRLRTLWVSQLPKAQFIWSWRKHEIYGASFEDLEFMHVDFCPRLTHVLPLSLALIQGLGLNFLRTLEIVWCGDLRAVFPLDTDAESYQDRRHQAITVKFQYLQRIHLHELPMLHGFCGRGRMYTPNLESMVIRGCWNLTRIPSVGGGHITKKVMCDCEKEWWDRLEWDGVQENHHPSLYEPSHPRYYKNTLLRGSVLI